MVVLGECWQLFSKNNRQPRGAGLGGRQKEHDDVRARSGRPGGWHRAPQIKNMPRQTDEKLSIKRDSAPARRDFTGTPPNVIESVTAAAKSHLQTRERKKFMRDSKKDTVMGELIPGQRVMGDLVRSDVVLIPMAIDPHGNWGPLTQNLLAIPPHASSSIEIPFLPSACSCNVCTSNHTSMSERTHTYCSGQLET